MKITLRVFLLFLAVFLVPGSANCSEPLVFTIPFADEHASLGKYIKFYEDKTGELDVNDIQTPEIAKQFIASDENEPGFGFSTSAYWMRLTVLNPMDKKTEWFLENAYPLIDSIDLYIPDKNGVLSPVMAGDHRPFSAREISYRNVVFRLIETPLSQRTFYLRFKTSSSMNLPIKFWREDALIKKISNEQILYGIIFGACIIMIIYSLFLYFAFKDKVYISYAVFIFFWGMGQSAIAGLSFQYFWPNSIWWGNVSVPFLIFASLASMTEWARAALVTSKYAPRMDRFLKIVIALFVTGLAMSLIVPYAISIRIGTASSLILFILLIVTSFLCQTKDNPPAYYFSTAILAYFLGVVVFALKTFGLLPSNLLTNWSLNIGSFLLLVFFLLAIEEKITVERKERIIAQKDLETQEKLLEASKESERVLEEKVVERTKEVEKSYFQIKETLELLEKTKGQLIHSEKMASLGGLTAGIAHEIKNPLNFVKNFSELSVELLEEIEDQLDRLKDKHGTETYQDIIALLNDIKLNTKNVYDNGLRADRIVNSMMDHARGTKGEHEQVDINNLVDENINLAYHGYRAKDPTFNVTFTKDYDDSLGPVEVIPQDLSRVLLNIIGNGCYAVNEKQKKSDEDYSPELLITTKSVKDWILLIIRDNGFGISEEVRDQIFHPFFTTKPTGEGNTGLGLSISYDIVVEGHSGNIEATSEPGEFTEFIISLPAS